MRSTQVNPPEPVLIYRRIREAAHKPDPELVEWLATIKPKHWESLAWLVNNQFTPVDLYHHLHLLNVLDFVSPEEREFLEACARLAAEQEQLYFADVTRMVTALNAHGITATLLKGAALISGGYFPNAGQRFIRDIDFAVAPDVLDTTLSALEQHGFKMDLALPRPVEEYWRLHRHLPPMRHQDGFFNLECHLRPMDKTLLHAPPFDSKSLLENGRCIETAAGSVNIPCAEHLVVHAFYHSQLSDMRELAGVDDYRAMIDMSTVVAKGGESFDWSFVSDLISSINAQRSFALFVDRTAHCVDSRALEWRIDRSSITHKKRVYSYISSHQRVGRSLIATAIYARAIRRALSCDARTERAKLFEANPTELRFSPVWRQLFAPSVWTKHARLIASRIGIAN